MNNVNVLSGRTSGQKINVSSLKPDIYVLKVMLNENVYNERVIIK
jgi:hypothetical protein